MNLDFEAEVELKKSIVENFLATTELFIESGNVYIETKRNVDPYI